MRRLIALCILLASAGGGHAQEYDASIEVPEAEVRSGPSSKYYVTGILRQGDRVRVKRTLGEYLAIEPPLDAFSIVARQNLLMQRGSEAVVIEPAETFMGSTVVSDLRVKGEPLAKGTIVRVLKEFDADTATGKMPFCKIVPLNESRYILTSATQKSSIVRAGGASGGDPARPGTVRPVAGGAPARIDDHIGALLNRADLAYKRGYANGDWREAKEVYEEIERSNNHEARTLASNRLSYIRRQAPQLFAGSGSTVTSGSARPGSTYSPGAPPSNPLRPVSGSANESGSRAKPTSGSPITFRGGNTGKLLRAGTREQNRPMYYLEDSQGKLLFYVAPTTGLDLEPWVGQRVEIQGGPMVYRHDLRGNYRLATSAKRVQ
jgi:hypothetical protein